jgi:uncharacterized repeat protein (TIGR01451 family)
VASLVALLSVGIFASPAFAHSATVTGAASCGTSTYSITWTITNDYNEVETATVTSVTGGTGTLGATSVTIGNGSQTKLTSATITQTLPATTTGTDTINVTSTWPNPSPYTQNNTASVSLPTGCWPAAGVTVVKSIASPTPPVSLPAGSPTQVVYHLTVHNTSTVLPTASAVNVTDAVPADTTYVAGSASCVTGGSPTCSASESGSTVSYALASGLAASASYVLAFAVTVNSGAPSGTIPNTATWTGPGCTPTAPATTCSTNTVFVTVTNPDITVVKSANVTSVTAGQTAPVIYTLTVANDAAASTAPTAAPVTVTDTVPAGLTFVSSSCGALTSSSSPTCTTSYDSSTSTVSYTLGAGIAVGASFPLTFTSTVNASDTTSIVNTASWTGPTCVPTAPATTCGTNTVTITVANVTVTKSDSAGSASVNPGDVVTYTLAADNIGTGPGSITVNDSAPTGTTLTTPAAACPANTSSTCSVAVSGSNISWIITNLPAGATYDLTFAVKVNPGTGGTQILNTGVYTEPGCTTVGGCSTNTTTNPVPPPTSSNTPTTTTTTNPTTTVKTAANGGAITDATTVHTGEPWAGSTPYVLAVLAFGLSLFGLGQVRRRRAARTPTV